MVRAEEDRSREGRPGLKVEWLGLREIALDVIDEPRAQMRHLDPAAEFEELCRSLREGGVLQPLLVEDRGERYRVVTGHRRLRAAREVGLFVVPCLVVQADAEWIEWATLTENRVRQPVNVLDEALWVTRRVEGYGGSQVDVARVLGVSESWVSQRVAVCNWPAEIRKELAEGHVGFAVGRELAGILDPVRRRQALRQAVVSGVTVRQAADWRRRSNLEASGGSVSQAAETVPAGSQLGAEYRSRCRACGVLLAESDQRFVLVCDGCEQILLSPEDAPPAESPRP